MQRVPLDIDPGQVVRWALAEHKATPVGLTLQARCSSEIREIPSSKEVHLGDEEREDLSEVATVATLEIAPSHKNEGWLLTVTVEDEAGPRLSVVGRDEVIDPGTFYSQFIRPGRGTAAVVVEAKDAKALQLVTQLLKDIETNQHPLPGP